MHLHTLRTLLDAALRYEYVIVHMEHTLTIVREVCIPQLPESAGCSVVCYCCTVLPWQYSHLHALALRVTQPLPHCCHTTANVLLSYLYYYCYDCFHKQLTTGQTFFKLYKEFKGSMSAYAALLKSKLPQPVSGGSVGLSQQYRIAENGEVPICYIINTGKHIN
jgi:hypothetical protein